MLVLVASKFHMNESAVEYFMLCKREQIHFNNNHSASIYVLDGPPSSNAKEKTLYIYRTIKQVILGKKELTRVDSRVFIPSAGSIM